MSYRRPPTCRYCYGRGHTRRSCPSLAAAAIQAAAKPAEQRDYQEARAVTLHERNVRKAAEPRQCSYCNHTGHNRKGCKDLKADIIRLSDYNRRWKQHIAAWLKSSDCPLKVGALLSFKNWQGVEYTCIALEVNPDFWQHSIARLFENTINNWFVRGSVLNATGRDRYGPEVGQITNFSAPAGALLSFESYNHNNVVYSNVVSDGCAPVEIPDGWLENVDVSRHFEKGRTKRYDGIFYSKRPHFEVIDELFKKFNIN